MNSNLKGGLFDGRGTPRPLEKRKAKDVTPEKKIQAQFFAWKKTHIHEFPVLKCIFAVPNGIWTFKAVAIEMVRQGLTEGIQDVIVLSPSFDKTVPGLLIEFKNEIGEQSEAQLFYHYFFAELGYRTEVCRSWWEAAKIVNEHLGLKIPVYPK